MKKQRSQLTSRYCNLRTIVPHCLLWALLTFNILTECAIAQSSSHPILDAKLRSADASETSLRQYGDEPLVLVFFSTTCPICQKYSLTLRALQNKYQAHGLRFVLIFPDSTTTTSGLASFSKKYRLNTSMFVDYRQELTEAVDAHTTPEVVLLSRTAEVLYQGRIDNLFVAPGRMRSIVTEHDLEDAIDDALSSKPPRQTKTKTIGCLIERLRK